MQHTSVLKFYNESITGNDVVRAEMNFASFIIDIICLLLALNMQNTISCNFPWFYNHKRKKKASAQTETIIVIKLMVRFTQNVVFVILRNNFFAVVTNASNIANNVKLHFLVVSYFNETQRKIETNRLSIIKFSENTREENWWRNLKEYWWWVHKEENTIDKLC